MATPFPVEHLSASSLTKRCCSCGEIKAVDDFYLRGDGTSYRRSDCKRCHNKKTRVWEAQNKDKSRSYSRKFYGDDRERGVVMAQATRARRAGRRATLTTEEWKEVLVSFDYKCAYCFSPYQEMDHVIHFSDGGHHEKSNVVPACISCNRGKGGTSFVPHIGSRFWPPTERMLSV